MAEEHGNNGWGEWKRLVLSKLEDQSKDIAELRNVVNQQNIQLAKMETSFKLKSGVWGAMSGIIAALLAILIKAFM